VTNPFEVDLLIRRAADLGVRENSCAVRWRLRLTGVQRCQPSGGVAKLAPSDSRDDIAERSLVGLMLRVPTLIEKDRP